MTVADNRWSGIRAMWLDGARVLQSIRPSTGHLKINSRLLVLFECSCKRQEPCTDSADRNQSGEESLPGANESVVDSREGNPVRHSKRSGASLASRSAFVVTPRLIPMSPMTTATATLTSPNVTPTANSVFTSILAQMFCRMTPLALPDSA